MTASQAEPSHGAIRALSVSTAAFAACFAVWTVFSIIGLAIQDELQLSETQFGLLIGAPLLTGALSRGMLGALSDHHGGRRIFPLVMLLAAGAMAAASFAQSYVGLLLAALGVGVAGGAFAVGISYVSRFFPSDRQGVALGIFSIGTAGAVITEFLAPSAMVALGWRGTIQLWAAGLLMMALVFVALAHEEPARTGGDARKTLAEELRLLKNLQVWRFSLYYFVLFGAFAGLALWLPRYLVGVYGLDVKVAGALTAAFVIPATLLRIYGGELADRYGARAILYWTFGASALLAFMLSYPPTDYAIHGAHGVIAFSTSLGLAPFVVVLLILGFFLSLGMSAVLKHIPTYYPEHVGTVGGIVSMAGGIGGFVLPLIFGVLNDLTGIWTSCFFLLFLLSLTSLAWMHAAVRLMEAQAGAARDELPELPELIGEHRSLIARGAAPPRRPVQLRRPPIDDWRPEDIEFWQTTGRRIANRNLWISTYCLLLAFAVWMVWSVVVARLPAAGFQFTPDQLFWLAALPGLLGATLRGFYSFVVPLFGGRLWTAISTASLLIPAFGIGYAVQNPQTPFLIFVVLALLCGLGGGNFASSMANISFFFPKAEKGSALAVNAGLGNLGVSLMQFVVPLAITVSIFGALGGAPQTSGGEQIWMQNAGFIWVPFILIGTALAWFGMDDLVSVKSSLADQAAIFERRHTWLMCWLYLGTFGSFIGFSAGFPLLARLAFPNVDSLPYVFLGPLIGALSRAGTGWLADRYGGGRITLLVFVCMIGSVAGALWSLDAGSFWGFFAAIMALFFFSGVGNASTFQMIPAIWRETVGRKTGDTGQADREAAAVIGFTSAIAAFGAFFIPKTYGASIAATGAADAALWAFMIFYLSCALLTFAIYVRPGGLLHAVESR